MAMTVEQLMNLFKELPKDTPVVITTFDEDGEEVYFDIYFIEHASMSGWPYISIQPFEEPIENLPSILSGEELDEDSEDED